MEGRKGTIMADTDGSAISSPPKELHGGRRFENEDSGGGGVSNMHYVRIPRAV